ncbi:class I SAM-dependent methyltransferase [Pseudomonas syringae]|uniref:class I SAM-dependent methyltransferase n=1 Tax=Pseudomonas syringae TaxID=317 RepID=UPI000EFE8B50|nr:class I SAM-dependent methyltransferase [Pseudomonas syringae]
MILPHIPDVIIEFAESNGHCAQELWDREYEQAPTIPSSLRAAPAHALVELMKTYEFPAARALDLGCGNGRNSLFLASLGMRVTALDFCPKAVALTLERVEEAGLSGSVDVVNQNLLDGIPGDDESYDLVMDAYSLCHFTRDEDQRRVVHEVARVLKPGGYFIKIHVDSSDVYYLERLHTRTSYGHISFDPANGLKKMHCSLATYTEQVVPQFTLVEAVNIAFPDDVRGKVYDRSIFACLMQKVKRVI